MGFQNLSVLNKAYMLKLGWWQLLNNPSKLWVRIMKSKYKCGPQAMPHVVPHANSSRTWRGITSVWNVLKANIFWVIREGVQTRFWKDQWIHGITNLNEELHRQILDAEKDFCVAHYVKDNGWDWVYLKTWIPEDICQKLAVIKPPVAGTGDFPCWKLTSDGQFSLNFPCWKLISRNFHL